MATTAACLSEAKRCSRCGQHRPRSDFHKSAKAADGLNSWCRPCRRAYAQQRFAQRPRPDRRAYIREWHRLHPLNRVWCNILTRCYNEKCPAYPNYGGRGIRLCDRWRDSFATFEADMLALGWRPGLTIDREDNDGDYEPGNVRFVTRKVNSRNKRDNRRLTFCGQTRTLVEWSEATGIKRTAITQRIDAYGWSVEQALTTPVRRRTCTRPARVTS